MSLSNRSKQYYKPGDQKKVDSIEFVGMGGDIKNTTISDNYATLISNFKPGKGSEWTKREGTILMKAITADTNLLSEERDADGNILKSNVIINPDYSFAFEDEGDIKFFAIKDGLLFKSHADKTTMEPWYGLTERFTLDGYQDGTQSIPNVYTPYSPKDLTTYKRIDEDSTSVFNTDQKSSRTTFKDYAIWTIGERILVYPLNGEWACAIDEKSELPFPIIDKFSGLPRIQQGHQNKFWIQLPPEQLDTWKYSQQGESYNVNFLSSNPGFKTQPFIKNNSTTLLINTSVDGEISNKIANEVTNIFGDVDMSEISSFLLTEKLNLQVYIDSPVIGKHMLLDKTVEYQTDSFKNKSIEFNFINYFGELESNLKHLNDKNNPDYIPVLEYLENIKAEVNIIGEFSPNIQEQGNIEILDVFDKGNYLKVDLKFNDANAKSPLVELQPGIGGLVLLEKWDPKIGDYTEVTRVQLSSDYLGTDNIVEDITFPEWDSVEQGKIYRVVVYYIDINKLKQIAPETVISNLTLSQDSIPINNTPLSISDPESTQLVIYKEHPIVVDLLAATTTIYDMSGNIVSGPFDIVATDITVNHNNELLMLAYDITDGTTKIVKVNDDFTLDTIVDGKPGQSSEAYWGVLPKSNDVIYTWTDSSVQDVFWISKTDIKTKTEFKVNYTLDSSFVDAGFEVSAIYPTGKYEYYVIALYNTLLHETYLIEQKLEFGLVQDGSYSFTPLFEKERVNLVGNDVDLITWKNDVITISDMKQQDGSYVSGIDELEVHISYIVQSDTVEVVFIDRHGNIYKHDGNQLLSKHTVVADVPEIITTMFDGGDITIITKNNTPKDGKDYEAIMLTFDGEKLLTFTSETPIIFNSGSSTDSRLYKVVNGALSYQDIVVNDSRKNVISNISTFNYITNSSLIEDKYAISSQTDNVSIEKVIDSDDLFILTEASTSTQQIIRLTVEDGINIDNIGEQIIGEQLEELRVISEEDVDVNYIFDVDVNVDLTQELASSTETNSDFIINWTGDNPFKTETDFTGDITSDWWRKENNDDWTIYGWVIPSARDWYTDRSPKWFIRDSGPDADLEQAAVMRLGVLDTDWKDGIDVPHSKEMYVRIPRSTSSPENRQQKTMLRRNWNERKRSLKDIINLFDEDDSKVFTEVGVEILNLTIDAKWTDIKAGMGAWKKTLASSTGDANVDRRILYPDVLLADSTFADGPHVYWTNIPQVESTLGEDGVWKGQNFYSGSGEFSKNTSRWLADGNFSGVKLPSIKGGEFKEEISLNGQETVSKELWNEGFRIDFNGNDDVYYHKNNDSGKKVQHSDLWPIVNSVAIPLKDRDGANVFVNAYGGIDITFSNGEPYISTKLLSEQIIAGQSGGASYANWGTAVAGVGSFKRVAITNVKARRTEKLKIISFMDKNKTPVKYLRSIKDNVTIRGIERVRDEELGVGILGMKNNDISLTVDMTNTNVKQYGSIIEAYKSLPFTWAEYDKTANTLTSNDANRLQVNLTQDDIYSWSPSSITLNSIYNIENKLMGNVWGLVGNTIFWTEYNKLDENITTSQSVVSEPVIINVSAPYSQIDIIGIEEGIENNSYLIVGIGDKTDIITQGVKLNVSNLNEVSSIDEIYQYVQKDVIREQSEIDPRFILKRDDENFVLITKTKVMQGKIVDIVVNDDTGESITTIAFYDWINDINIDIKNSIIETWTDNLFTYIRVKGILHKSIIKEKLTSTTSNNKLKQSTARDSGPIPSEKVVRVVADRDRFELFGTIDSTIVSTAFRNIINMFLYTEKNDVGEDVYKTSYNYGYQFPQLSFNHFISDTTTSTEGVDITHELLFNYNLEFDISKSQTLQESTKVNDIASNEVFQNNIISQSRITPGIYSIESISKPFGRIITGITGDSIENTTNFKDGIISDPPFYIPGNDITQPMVDLNSEEKPRVLQFIKAVPLEEISISDVQTAITKSLDLTNLAENDFLKIADFDETASPGNEKLILNDARWKPFIDYDVFVPQTTGRVMVISIVLPWTSSIWMKEDDFPFKLDDSGLPTDERVIPTGFRDGKSKWIKPESFKQLLNYTQTKIIEVVSDEKDVDKSLTMAKDNIWVSSCEFYNRLILASEDKIYISDENNPFFFPSFVTSVPTDKGKILRVLPFQGNLLVVLEKGFAVYTPNVTSSNTLYFTTPSLERKMPTVLNENCIAANSTSVDVVTVDGVYRIYQYQMSATNIPALKSTLLSTQINHTLKQAIAKSSDVRLYESLYKTIVKVSYMEDVIDGDPSSGRPQKLVHRLYIFDAKKQFQITKTAQKWYTFESEVFDIDQLVTVTEGGKGHIYFSRLGAAELLRYGYDRLINKTIVPGYKDRMVPKLKYAGQSPTSATEIIQTEWGYPVKSVILSNGMSSENMYDIKVKVISNQVNHHGFTQSYYRKYYLLDSKQGQFIDSSEKDNVYEVISVETVNKNGEVGKDYKIRINEMNRYSKRDLSGVNKLDIALNKPSSIRMKDIEVFDSEDFVVEDKKNIGSARTSQIKTAIIHDEDLPFTFKKIRFVIKEKKHK